MDALLFKQIQDGHREALNQLFDQYFERLCTVVNVYVNEPGLAEEIVSDLFFNLWVKRNQLQISGSLKAYLYKAACNQAISYLRKPSFPSERLQEDQQYAPIASPEDMLIEQESGRHIQALINSLPKRCQLIFMMHKEDGLSYLQIADILNISVKTVENQMGKALKLLRERYVRYNKFSSR
jgi:RNA polymerase sigma-70 factor, ECF subfamily